jgi:hypothetical protein
VGGAQQDSRGNAADFSEIILSWTRLGTGAGELRQLLREQAGLNLAAHAPADGDESASTFLATGQDGTVSVLKISPSATGDSVGRLRELAAGLRRRGCSLPAKWTA